MSSSLINSRLLTDREKRRTEIYSSLSNEYKEFEDFLVSARARVKINQLRYSSKSSDPSINQAVFFEIFMKIPVVIGEKLFVKPVYWAVAFMKFYIGDIASTLFRAVLTQDDVTNGDGVNISEKIRAVKRAAKWMTTKNQDPWSWSLHSFRGFKDDIYGELTSEEHLAVETACQNVKATDLYPPFQLDGLIEESTDWQTSLWASEEEICEFGFSILKAMMLTDDSLPELGPSCLNELKEISNSTDDSDTKFFCKIVGKGILGNAAQTVRELTKITIPKNTEIFVDAVQFSKKRFQDASKEPGIGLIANQLLRKYWGTNSTETSFRSISDICPVTRLAIIRAAKWIAINRNVEDILDFDSATPYHNVDFTEPEVELIENGFKEYVGMIRGPNGEILKDPKFQNRLDVEMDELSIQENAGEALNGWVNNNLQPDLEMETSAPEKPLQTSTGNEFTTFANNSETIQEPQLVQDIQPMVYQDLQSYNVSVASPVLSETSSSLGTDMQIYNGDMSPRPGTSSSAATVVHDTLRFDLPEPVQAPPQIPVNTIDCICVMETIHLQIDAETSNVIIGDEGFSMSRGLCWEDAFKKLNDRSEPQAKVGLILFGKLFEKSELQIKTKELCPTRKQGILDALAIMKTLIRKSLKLSDYAIGIKHKIKVHKRSVEELGYLEIKIFTEGRNYFAKKKN